MKSLFRNLPDGVNHLENGGTLAVYLACHALQRGYQAIIYTWNLQVFDPTWFPGDAKSLTRCLEEQREFKQDSRIQEVTSAYQRFLELGGELRMEDLSSELIREFLNQNMPILTGLSATWLYHESREIGYESTPDDIRGTPQGHFVVLCGYEHEQRRVLVADPLHPDPNSLQGQKSLIKLNRVISAITLGIVTYDANLLILIPPDSPSEI